MSLTSRLRAVFRSARYRFGFDPAAERSLRYTAELAKRRCDMPTSSREVSGDPDGPRARPPEAHVWVKTKWGSAAGSGA